MWNGGKPMAMMRKIVKRGKIIVLWKKKTTRNSTICLQFRELKFCVAFFSSFFQYGISLKCVLFASLLFRGTLWICVCVGTWAGMDVFVSTFISDAGIISGYSWLCAFIPEKSHTWISSLWRKKKKINLPITFCPKVSQALGQGLGVQWGKDTDQTLRICQERQILKWIDNHIAYFLVLVWKRWPWA